MTKKTELVGRERLKRQKVSLGFTLRVVDVLSHLQMIDGHQGGLYPQINMVNAEGDAKN